MSYVKVYKYKKQISLDNGVTWQDVVPEEYVPSGDPIGYYDTLEECMTVYRTIQSGYTCVGYDKHNQDVFEVSYDNGVTWSVVSTSAGTLIEADSPDCGYVPPTPCECSAFTFDATSHTITDTAQSVTFNYSGCTKPDLSSASTYGWMLIANHVYNAETTVGYITANVSANTNSARTGILYTSLSGSTCQNLVISQQAPTPTPTSAKYVLTLNDSSTVSAECDSTSAITSAETSSYYRSSATSVAIFDCVTSIGNGAFMYYESLSSVTIGNNVETIGELAFVLALTHLDGIMVEITIPDSVTSIGYGAFAQNTNLISVTVEATTPPTLGSSAFDNTSDNLVIYVPASSVNTYKSASGWRSYSSRIQAIP